MHSEVPITWPGAMEGGLHALGAKSAVVICPDIQSQSGLFWFY
jgi:hypothetical protein